MSKARFGEQRLALPDVSGAERLLFHAMGLPIPLTVCTAAISCARSRGGRTWLRVQSSMPVAAVWSAPHTL